MSRERAVNEIDVEGSRAPVGVVGEVERRRRIRSGRVLDLELGRLGERVGDARRHGARVPLGAVRAEQRERERGLAPRLQRPDLLVEADQAAVQVVCASEGREIVRGERRGDRIGVEMCGRGGRADVLSGSGCGFNFAAALGPLLVARL